MAKENKCPKCGGWGLVQRSFGGVKPCLECGGKGWIEGESERRVIRFPCPNCEGKMAKENECPECAGTGKVDEAGTDMISECFECHGSGTKKERGCPHCGAGSEDVAYICEYCGEKLGEYDVYLTYGDNKANMRQTKAFCRMTCLWNWMLAG